MKRRFESLKAWLESREYDARYTSYSGSMALCVDLDYIDFYPGEDRREALAEICRHVRAYYGGFDVVASESCGMIYIY